MQVTVERSARDRLQGFFEYLKSRAQDKDHDGNRDLIADFVDKFVVFELKRLANKDETSQEQIEIPDDVFVEPLMRAKASLDNTFDGFVKSLGADPKAVNTGALTAPTVQTKPDLQKPAGNVGSGNGHRSDKKRDLADPERDTIKAEFLKLNGELADNDKECTRIHGELNSLVVVPLSVWQVTGFISVCHRYVAEGTLMVGDLPKYLDWMKAKYPAMAARYDSPKFQQLRAKNQSGSAKPKFKTGLKAKP